MVSYCSDIVEAKHISAVKHGLAIVRHCNRFITTIKNFETMDKHDMSHSFHTFHAPRVVSNFKREIEGYENVGDETKVHLRNNTVEATLTQYPLASWESF